MRPNGQWHQANVTFTDRDDAQRLAVTHIGPILRDAEEDRLVSAWFFIRKQQWRWRWLPTSPAAADTVLRALTGADPSMTWTMSVCEFESLAFGGPAGLDTACALFHADSHHLLDWLRTDRPLGQRETSALLSSALLRGAGLDWFEQGDVWARVSELRPHADTVFTDTTRARELLDAMRTLMTIDATGLCDPDQNGPLSGYRTWIAAFHETGQTLARLDHDGHLQRGLRAILAHHLIFHFNRAGLNSADQATMAALAVEVIFHHPRNH